MKKLLSSIVILASALMVGCSSTMEVSYTPITEVETKTDWEIDTATGAWQAVESQTFITVEQKEVTLPTHYDRFNVHE